MRDFRKLRKLKPEEEKVISDFHEVQEKFLSDKGKRLDEFSVDEIDELSARVHEQVPGMKGVTKKNLEAFQIKSKIEGEGGLN